MKKHILGALMALALLLTLFPATVAAASGDAPTIGDVNFLGAHSVELFATSSGDCTLYVGLYDEYGKMLEVRTQKVTGKAGEQRFSVTFDADADAESADAKAVLLDSDTLAPLCKPNDTKFHPDEYALIERIVIETTADNVTTKTGSMLGMAGTNFEFTGANSGNWQLAYNQSKEPVGTSLTEAQAILRFSDGTRRTVTLDDSRNYRTSAQSDAAYIAQAVSYDAEGYPLDSSGNRIYPIGDNSSGMGDGNWIAEGFTAGRIVRYSASRNEDNYNIYTLKAVNDEHVVRVFNFNLQGKRMYSDNFTITAYIFIDGIPRPATVVPDSGTRFVIEDLNAGTYKAYDGVKNAPGILIPAASSPHFAANPLAYIYHIDGYAKLVFVTQAWEVSYPDPNYTPEPINDNFTFLAAHTTSNLIQSDDGAYYEVNAVVNGEVTTVKVKQGVSFSSSGATFTPGSVDTQKESDCVLLNNVTYDSNGLITMGEWRNGGDYGYDFTGQCQGVRRRPNEDEIRLNLAGVNSFLKDVAEDVRVYFVDGSDIRRISYSGIVNDVMDYVYYVENGDGEITHLFIVDYEPAPAPAPVIIAGSISFNTVGNAATYHLMPGATAPDLETVRNALNALDLNFTYSNASATQDANGNLVYTYTRINVTDNSTMSISVSFAYDATQGV